ncbi:MAG: Lrp/AsnC family transcriptional regulator [Candidatus Lokiarchaeota archaeon]|nr:Lrp/AsnC family transcriptional regulator [Candidatus Lokiarchaeota archaeon]
MDILKVLERDARISYRKISQELDISVGTVHNRILKLKENGIIQGYLLALNENKLNFKLKAVISLEITGTKIREIMEKLSKYPEVTNAYSISGNISAILICRFQKMKDIRNFTNLLNGEEDIQKVETNIVLDIYKEDLHHLLSSEIFPPTNQ